MGKGLSQRRRAANFLKAKKEAGKLSGLPPPPEEVGGKRKRRGAQDDMPSSLRHMLELKAKLEGQQRKRPKLDASRQPAAAAVRPLLLTPGDSSPLERPSHVAAAAAQPVAAQPAGGAAELSGGEPAEGLGPEGCGTGEQAADERGDGTGAGVPAAELPRGHGKAGTQQSAGHDRKASHPSALPAGKDNGGAGIGADSRQDPWQPDGGAAAPGAAFPPRSGLKQRKKDFLNRRKLKKRGRAVSEAEAGDRLERRLLQDPQRPAFGEQALAPLKVNLKRKHWGASGAEPRTGQRCREVFHQRMAPASAAGAPAGQGSLRGKAQQGREQQGARRAPAGKPPVVKAAGEGPAAGGPGAGAARGRQGRGFKALEARRAAAAATAAQSELRDTMVRAYRERARGPQAGGPASARSLAALVQREAPP